MMKMVKVRRLTWWLLVLETVIIGTFLSSINGITVGLKESIYVLAIIAITIATGVMTYSNRVNIKDRTYGFILLSLMMVYFLSAVIVGRVVSMLPQLLFLVIIVAALYKNVQLSVMVLGDGIFIIIALAAMKIIGFVQTDQTVYDHIVFSSLFVIGSLVSIFIIKKDNFDERVAKEQERSMDDLMVLVDKKCDEANASAKAKSTFLANMSHEIRTPINAVLGMNEMILREADNDAILAYSQNISSAGKTLLSLINDVLDFSKIESGSMEIMPEQYELNRILYDLILVITPRLEAKGLELVLDFDENMPNVLYGDEVRIRQVITNLLTNAVKYTMEGSVTFSVKAEPGIFPDTVDVKVSVKDTGIGIKESKAELFSSFRRGDDLRAHHIEGTGLGLTITQQLLKMMGSDLEMTSVYGEGSEFFFTLNQQVRGEEPLGDIKQMFLKANVVKNEYRESFVAPHAKILVVDDNAMNLEVIKALLKTTQVQIFTANDGAQCLEITKREVFDLILMDHLMPVMDGIEAFHAIRNDKANPNNTTKVIILTANAVAGMKQGYLNEGFDGFLSKPVESKLLEQTLISFLPDSLVTLIKIDSVDSVEEQEKITIVSDAIEQLNILDLNLEDAIRFSSGRVVDVLENIANYVNEYENVRKKLIEEREQCKISDFTIHIHALKSTSRVVGATHMGKIAENMEKAARGEDIIYINSNFPSLLEEYDEVVRDMALLLEIPAVARMRTTSVEESMDDDEYIAKAENFISAIESFDVDFDELKAFASIYPKSHNLQDERESLAEAADNFDYDGMTEALNNILEKVR